MRPTPHNVTKLYQKWMFNFTLNSFSFKVIMFSMTLNPYLMTLVPFMATVHLKMDCCGLKNILKLPFFINIVLDIENYSQIKYGLIRNNVLNRIDPIMDDLDPIYGHYWTPNGCRGPKSKVIKLEYFWKMTNTTFL